MAKLKVKCVFDFDRLIWRRAAAEHRESARCRRVGSAQVGVLDKDVPAHVW